MILAWCANGRQWDLLKSKTNDLRTKQTMFIHFIAHISRQMRKFRLRKVHHLFERKFTKFTLSSTSYFPHTAEMRGSIYNERIIPPLVHEAIVNVDPLTTVDDHDALLLLLSAFLSLIFRLCPPHSYWLYARVLSHTLTQHTLTHDKTHGSSQTE